MAGGGAVQHEAVDVIRSQMFERTGHGLGDLGGEIGLGVVRQTMILTVAVGEFRLKEKIRPSDNAGVVRSGESFADSGFEVMPPLVGGVDAAEAGLERELNQGSGAVFLPG